jgi:cobalt-precorrin-5B (C1)-methyltransferase
VSLRTGITTGTCAAAAARAAASVLAGQAPPSQVPVELPDGRTLVVPVLRAGFSLVGRIANPSSTVGRIANPSGSQADLPDGLAIRPTEKATAAVRKDAGDDPDVTDGLEIVATVSWTDGDAVTFSAGEGVGTVTKPGLQVPPGQPAINPVPRRMIVAAVRQVTSRGLHVEIAIPGGRKIAAKTFNPRLGIAGGLSILGTSGIVRPYCTRALHDALGCAINVAVACGVTAPVLVPGAIGCRAARARFVVGDQQLIEVGNAWGFVLDLLPRHAWRALLLVGHPGKLAKLAAGQWDTHSSRSDPPTHFVADLCAQLWGPNATAGSSSNAPGATAGLSSSAQGIDGQSNAGVAAGANTHDCTFGPGVAAGANTCGSTVGPGVAAGADTLAANVSPGGHAGLEGVNHDLAGSATTEGIFAALDDRQRTALGSALAARIRQSVADRLHAAMPVAVLLVDMSGRTLGYDGDLSPWQ